jgi:hypothetical protein
MNETILGATLAGNMIMIILFWVMVKEMRRDLFGISNKVDEGIGNIEVEIPDLEELRQEIIDVLGSMHTPTFVDHIGGMVSAWGQQKLMRSMQDIIPGAEMLGEEIVHNDEPPSD